MRKYLRTSPKRKRRIASRILLVVATVLLIAWAYGFVADHPNVWSHRPPRLDEGLAIVITLLTPIAILAYLVERVFRRKERPRGATSN